MHEVKVRLSRQNHIILALLPVSGLFAATIASAGILSATPTHANVATSVSLLVGKTCTISSNTTAHAVTIPNGTYNKNIPGITLRTICNGGHHYSISAIGYTNNTDGNTSLFSNTNSIPTSTALDGTTSGWAMKLTPTAGNTAQVENGYADFSLIPSSKTTVATYQATSTQSTDSTLQTTYGVSISPTQPAGTYTGAVKYTLEYSAYQTIYLQELTLDDCKVNVGTNGNASNVGDTLTYYDRRDGNDYTVRYINGACWMTQNLRFTGTELNSATSNVASTYTTTSPYYVNGSSIKAWKSLKDDSVCKGTSLDTNTSTNLCMQDSGDTTKGIWYNYAAASAGTITGVSNSTTAIYDICPAGWHLPTGAANNASSEFYKLFQSTSTGNIAANTYLVAFNNVAGGYYNGGSLYSGERGYWWSATTYNADITSRYALRYNGNNQFFNGYGTRRNGYFVRCVRTS